jgi:uncharacterized protein (TIRG00374 family)
MALKRYPWFKLLRYAGIVIFIIVLARTDLKELWDWLKQVNIWWVALAFIFQILLLFIKCLRWLWLNEKGFHKKNVYQRFGEFLEAYAMGSVTPGRLGEIVKAGHAKGRSSVVSSGLLVIAERGLDLSLFFLMAGISLSLGYITTLGQSFGYFITLIAFAGITMAFSILLFPGVVGLVDKIMKRVRLIKDDQTLIFVPRKGKALAIFSILSILSNLIAFLSFYFIAIAILIQLDFMTVSGSVALAGIINSIPVTIMGIGTRDVTLLYVLSEIPKAQVLGFSALILLVSQIGGGVIALVSGQFFLFNARQVRSSQEAVRNQQSEI